MNYIANPVQNISIEDRNRGFSEEYQALYLATIANSSGQIHYDNNYEDMDLASYVPPSNEDSEYANDSRRLHAQELFDNDDRLGTIAKDVYEKMDSNQEGINKGKLEELMKEFADLAGCAEPHPI